MRSEKTSLSGALEQAWLDQVVLEYQEICALYGLDLNLPLIQLDDARSRLGAWCQEERRLSLSRQLIRHYRWHQVVQVLKHEMAHQLCQERIRPGYTGHGAPFLQAGRLLGLDPAYASARADLHDTGNGPDRGTGAGLREGRRVLARVDKLLALAGSENEHEAALALQRAGELLARHNLSREQAAGGFVRRVISTGYQRLPRHLLMIAALLRDFFHVQVVIGDEYDLKRNRRSRTVEFFGRPENVAVAEHCWAYLGERLESLWQKEKERFGKQGRRTRSSYLAGVVAGVRQRFEKKGCPGKNRDGGHALVVIGDPELDRFVALFHPRLHRCRGRRIRVETAAYRAAVAVGAALPLHRAVEKPADQGLFLEE